MNFKKVLAAASALSIIAVTGCSGNAADNNNTTRRYSVNTANDVNHGANLGKDRIFGRNSSYNSRVTRKANPNLTNGRVIRNTKYERSGLDEQNFRGGAYTLNKNVKRSHVNNAGGNKIRGNHNEMVKRSEIGRNLKAAIAPNNTAKPLTRSATSNSIGTDHKTTNNKVINNKAITKTATKATTETAANKSIKPITRSASSNSAGMAYTAANDGATVNKAEVNKNAKFKIGKHPTNGKRVNKKAADWGLGTTGAKPKQHVTLSNSASRSNNSVSRSNNNVSRNYNNATISRTVEPRVMSDTNDYNYSYNNNTDNYNTGDYSTSNYNYGRSYYGYDNAKDNDMINYNTAADEVTNFNNRTRVGRAAKLRSALSY